MFFHSFTLFITVITNTFADRTCFQAQMRPFRRKGVISVRQLWQHQGNFLWQKKKKRNQQKILSVNNLVPPTIDSVGGEHLGNHVSQSMQIPVNGQRSFTTLCTMISPLLQHLLPLPSHGMERHRSWGKETEKKSCLVSKYTQISTLS